MLVLDLPRESRTYHVGELLDLHFHKYALRDLECGECGAKHQCGIAFEEFSGATPDRIVFRVNRYWAGSKREDRVRHEHYQNQMLAQLM